MKTFYLERNRGRRKPYNKRNRVIDFANVNGFHQTKKPKFNDIYENTQSVDVTTENRHIKELDINTTQLTHSERITPEYANFNYQYLSHPITNKYTGLNFHPTIDFGGLSSENFNESIDSIIKENFKLELEIQENDEVIIKNQI